MNSQTKRLSLLAIVLIMGYDWPAAWAAEGGFDGLNLNLGNLYRVSHAQSRSISPENFTGEKGKGGMATEGTGKNAARELGQGWKVSPSVAIKAKSTFTIATIEGSGASSADRLEGCGRCSQPFAIPSQAAPL